MRTPCTLLTLPHEALPLAFLSLCVPLPRDYSGHMMQFILHNVAEGGCTPPRSKQGWEFPFCDYRIIQPPGYECHTP